MRSFCGSRLEDALSELARADIASLPDAALSEEIVELTRTADRLRVEAARRLAIFHRRRACAGDGSTNTTQWLRWHCRMLPSTAANLLALAEQFGALPEVERSAASGVIGVDHATVIARTAQWVGPEAMGPVVRDFVGVSQRLDPAGVATAARWFRAHVDPERFARDHERDHELRGVSMSRSGGWYYLDGRLDLEGGAAVERALDGLMGTRGDGRTARQRRADALVELARSGGRAELLVIADERLRRGEVAGAGPVPPETLERTACDATITEFWIDEHGKLNVGRARRSWNPATRRAPVARDRHCRFPGCDRDATWCEGHHLVPWSEGGATRADQGVLLCRFHHRLVHARHLQVRLAGSDVVFAPP